MHTDDHDGEVKDDYEKVAASTVLEERTNMETRWGGNEGMDRRQNHRRKWVYAAVLLFCIKYFSTLGCLF